MTIPSPSFTWVQLIQDWICTLRYIFWSSFIIISDIKALVSDGQHCQHHQFLYVHHQGILGKLYCLCIFIFRDSSSFFIKEARTLQAEEHHNIYPLLFAVESYGYVVSTEITGGVVGKGQSNGQSCVDMCDVRGAFCFLSVSAGTWSILTSIEIHGRNSMDINVFFSLQN